MKFGISAHGLAEAVLRVLGELGELSGALKERIQKETWQQTVIQC